MCTLVTAGLMTFGYQKENIKQDKRDSETFILQKVKHKFCIAINYAKKDSIFDKNSPPLHCATLMEYLSCKNSQVKIEDINNVLTDRYSLAGGILITFIQPLNSGNGMRPLSPLLSVSPHLSPRPHPVARFWPQARRSDVSGENDQDDRNTIDLSILLGLILLRKDQYTHLHERVLLSTPFWQKDWFFITLWLSSCLRLILCQMSTLFNCKSIVSL